VHDTPRAVKNDIRSLDCASVQTTGFAGAQPAVCSAGGLDARDLPAAGLVVDDAAVDLGEEGVVAAAADALPRTA
jgi:hypothetical protein